MQVHPVGPLMHCEPAGQVPPHCGAVLCEHCTWTGVQLHAPVAAFELQTVPVGQTPPHRGAGLCVQGIGTSWQPHSVVPGIVRQSMFAGQSPPHVGYGLCEQARGGCTQSQTPAEFSVQLLPVGHAPPQAGAVDCPHVSTLSTQLQCPVTVFDLQVVFAGHNPPHCGARA